MVLLNEEDVIKLVDLPEIIKKQNRFKDDLLPFKKIKNKLITEFEADYFNSLLKKTKGNVSRAAKVGRLNRKHLIEKLKFYKIEPSQYKPS